MDVAILVYPGVTTFEALAPYGVYRHVRGAEVGLVAAARGRVPAQGSKVALVADRTYDEVPTADVVVVPGGLGIERLAEDAAATGWVATVHRAAQWTTAVSTGSVLLAAAGVLDGDATTHWLATGLLEERGARPVRARLVQEGRILTAEGALAGLQMALEVVRRMEGSDVADAVRAALDVDGLGRLDPSRPARPETLTRLAGPPDDDLTPYVLGSAPPPPKRRRSRRTAGGRIEILDS